MTDIAMDRTFGFELEFSGVDREKVDLPEGWRWSPDERNIVNPTATKATPSGSIGGEINTAPLRYCEEDLATLKRVIDQCFAAGGLECWNTGYDGHIYIKDLDLEAIKRLALLGIYMTPYVFEMFNLGDWLDVPHIVPRPSYEFLPRIRAATTMQALGNVLANSSNKGHYRFPFNIMSVFSVGTLEFRVFAVTRDFSKVKRCLDFMYAYVHYAINFTEEDFAKLTTVSKARAAFGVTGEFPHKTYPTIFAGPQDILTTSIGKHIRLSNRHINLIKRCATSSIYFLTPSNLEAPMKVYKDFDVTVCSRCEYTDILYSLATGELSIGYTDKFEFLNDLYDGSPLMKVIAFLIFTKMAKYVGDNEYAHREFNAYLVKVTESIEKLTPFAAELVTMVKHIKFYTGDQNDIVATAEPDATVVFNQIEPPKLSSVVSTLAKYSDYVIQKNQVLTDYVKLEKECCLSGRTLLVFSLNWSLGLHKIAVDNKVYAYSNKKQRMGERIIHDDKGVVSVKTPPDDYVVADYKDIKVSLISPTFLLRLQKVYVHKVIKVKGARYAFLVTDGDLVLGGFGFDYDKSDDQGLVLLSDFVTNNNCALLSKLILFLIMTPLVKSALERVMGVRLERSHTLVYTNRPVSMKYRGAFKKVPSAKPNRLVYEFTFGSVPSIKAAVGEYIKKVEHREKNK